MNTTSKSTPSFGISHVLVLALGLLVFVLLLFADKSNLNDDQAGQIANKSSASSEGTASLPPDASALLALVPPTSPSEDLALALTALEQAANTEERQSLLQEVVTGFRESGRLDVAAVYAGMLADEDPSSSNQVVAGALFRNATRLPAVQADSSVFNRFSDQAISYLDAAVAQAPADEGAKIELGLAMIGSQKPGNSMQGIFKIKEVAEANPQNTEALFHLGGFSMETAQYDKAEQRFRQILDVNPDDVRAKYYLGMTMEALGRSAEFTQLMSEVAEQQQEPELAAAAQAALNQ